MSATAAASGGGIPLGDYTSSAVLGGGVAVRFHRPRTSLLVAQGFKRSDSRFLPNDVVRQEVTLDTVTDFTLRAQGSSESFGEMLGMRAGLALFRGQGNKQAGAWDAEAFGNAGQAAFNYSFFPVVFVSAQSGRQHITVTPFVLAYSDVPMVGLTASGARPPEYVKYTVACADGTSRSVNLDSRYLRGPDAFASFTTAVANTFLRDSCYITISPYVSDNTYAHHVSDHQSAHAFAFSGTSFGIAAMMAIMGGPQVMYTGFVKNFGDRIAYASERGGGQGRAWGVADVPRAVTMVETVDYLDFKAAWAVENNFPLVMPALSLMREPLERLFAAQKAIEAVRRVSGPNGPSIQVSEQARQPRADAHPFLISVAKSIYTNTQLESGVDFFQPQGATPLLMAADPVTCIVLGVLAFNYFSGHAEWQVSEAQKKYASANPKWASQDPRATIGSSINRITDKMRSTFFPSDMPPLTEEERAKMFEQRQALKQKKGTKKLQEEIAAMAAREQARLSGNIPERGVGRAGISLLQLTGKDPFTNLTAAGNTKAAAQQYRSGSFAQTATQKELAKERSERMKTHPAMRAARFVTSDLLQRYDAAANKDPRDAGKMGVHTRAKAIAKFLQDPAAQSAAEQREPGITDLMASQYGATGYKKGAQNSVFAAGPHSGFGDTATRAQSRASAASRAASRAQAENAQMPTFTGRGVASGRNRIDDPLATQDLSRNTSTTGTFDLTEPPKPQQNEDEGEAPGKSAGRFRHFFGSF